MKSASGHRYPRGQRTAAGRARARRRQEQRWAAKAGPVVITQATRCECGAWVRPGHTCEAAM